MIYSIRFKIYFQIGKRGSFKYTQSRLTSPEIRIFSKELSKTVKEKNKKDVLILFNNAIDTYPKDLPRKFVQESSKTD